jgi:hypothetical protein
VRIEAFFSAVSQSMCCMSRSSSMALLEIMPRSPTITNCWMPNCSRKCCTSGTKVALSVTLPSCTDTATGQPRASASDLPRGSFSSQCAAAR